MAAETYEAGKDEGHLQLVVHLISKGSMFPNLSL